MFKVRLELDVPLQDIVDQEAGHAFEAGLHVMSGFRVFADILDTRGLCQQLGVIFHVLGQSGVFNFGQKHLLPMKVFCSLKEQPGEVLRTLLIIALDDGILYVLHDVEQAFMILIDEFDSDFEEIVPDEVAHDAFLMKYFKLDHFLLPELEELSPHARS
jgi:hypothetical protein